MLAKAVAEIRVHPSIGIARVGNSAGEFYIGPEAPGQVPNEGGSYKDAMGRVKRQGARFRLYAYAKDGTVLGEVTRADAQIDWSVHVANKKGSWFGFQSRFKPVADRKLRNRWTQADPNYEANPDLRSELIIDPGAASISADAVEPVMLEGGAFAGVKVDLGELRTDKAGRLIVLGGSGRSGTAVVDKQITTYANNDYWFDDTSDGPVGAKIVFPGGETFDAVAAHVIVAPPKFTPAHENVVRLWDVVACASGALPKRLGEAETVSFEADIRPLLERVISYTWVSSRAVVGHGPGMPADFDANGEFDKLADPAGDATERSRIFNRIRVPAELDAKANRKQACLNFMPPLSGDGGDAIDLNDPDPRVPPEQTWMTVTPRQYDQLQRWAEGKFERGNAEAYRPLEAIDVAGQPQALDRASLQACVGAPFFPGIEMTYIAEDPQLWAGPVRLNADVGAGDISRWMAVPWQADFYECNLHWWPAARPDDVLPQEATENVADVKAEDGNRAVAVLAERVPWARGLPGDSPAGDSAMVKYWGELGFVVPRLTGDGERYFVEVERAPVVGLDDREIFYRLMNGDQYPDVLPKAKEMVEYWLAQAELVASDPNSPASLCAFRYSEDTFRNRLDQIYSETVRAAADSDPSKNEVFKTRDDMIERIRQLAPFNLTDGAWLRNIGKTGPMDEVRSLLYSVAMDELGDGDVSKNHCNIYLDLCHTVGLYFPPIRSLEFAKDPNFLDSAFTLPAFELAISQFSDEYFPELIGMTLYLEWGVVETKSTRDLMKYFGLDPHFYVMHIGIDNAVNGHGERAAQAVRLYLTEVADTGGDDAVQEAWRRIWRGYVAFYNTGTFFADLVDKLTKPKSLRERLTDMIAAKAVYGQYNHEQHMVGANRINAWFQDPDGFLDALVANQYILPGDWEHSRLCGLLDFETGPMYRVFTPDEIELWAAYARALTEAPPQPAPVPTPVDFAQAMVDVVDLLRPQQQGEVGHEEHVLADKNGDKHSVSWWFDQPSAAFVAALADPANGFITPGKPETSTFVTEWTAPSGPMGEVFDQPSGAGRLTCRDVLTGWISAGCPIHPTLETFLGLRLNMLPPSFSEQPARKLTGMGTVH